LASVTAYLLRRRAARWRAPAGRSDVSRVRNKIV
jgi:hypothetical protein